MGQHFLTFRTWYDQCPRAWLSVLLEGKTGPLGRPCLPQSPGLLAALLPALGAWLAQHRVCAQSEQTVRVLGHWGWSERGKQKGQSPGPALLPGGPPPPGLSGEAPPSTAQTNPHRCLPRACAAGPTSSITRRGSRTGACCPGLPCLVSTMNCQGVANPPLCRS